MNFAEFTKYRETCLREQPSLLDAGATNLYAALAHLQPSLPLTTAKVHRCHLAQDWLAHFGLAQEAAPRALVSAGVRDSLATLFSHYAQMGYRAWLPCDNYPVYANLASAAGLQRLSFRTLPTVGAPSDDIAWPLPAAGGPELLLVTNPIKPRGDYLCERDMRALETWLSADSRRRLLLDTVYTLSNRFHASTLRLLAGEQTILLHSLTKGWLRPKIFGIALVHERDQPTLTPLFRERPPPSANLQNADMLLREHSTLPGDVARALERASAKLRALVPDAVHLPNVASSSYLFPVALGHGELLDRYQVLGIPASVFGGDDELTVLSSLAWAHAPHSSICHR